jgi:hypothetical protein
MNSRTGRDAIDAAIDAAAHALTAGAPSSNLRAHVLARLAVRRARPSRLAWLTPLAAAALVLVVLVWLPHQRSATPRPAPPAAGESARARRVDAQAAPSTPAGPPAMPRDLHAARPAPAKRLEPASSVAALAPPPLTVDPIAVAPLDAAVPIRVPEIVVPPIEVAPLALDERSDTRRE